jgi:hypothetical protein
MGPKNTNRLKLLKLFTFIISVNHIFACIWNYTGKIKTYEHQNWLLKYDIQNENWLI